MTFDQAYAELEAEFKEQVCNDGAEYLPLARPEGPVDFVLIGMEPSLGRLVSRSAHSDREKRRAEVREKCELGLKNSAWSMEDFILHYCARHYLCRDGETYYITDLAKGAMLAKEAVEGRIARYERWYPILEKELGLVARQDAKIISIGDGVGRFLSRKGIYGHAGTIRHFSSQAAGHAGKEGDRDKNGGCGFSCGVGRKDILRVAEQVMMEYGMDGLSQVRLAALKRGAGLNEPRKKLLIDYKHGFDRIRNQDHTGWKYWQDQWRSRVR